jgi:hypothetical protein
MWRTIVLTCLLSCSSALHVAAQAVDTALQPNGSRPHRFFDTANIALTIGETGALLADGYTTQRGLKEIPWGREADPIARPFVNRGWPGQIVGGALVIGAELGVRYLLHRTNHHKLERFVPVGLIVYGTVGAVHNARLLATERVPPDWWTPASSLR